MLCGPKCPPMAYSLPELRIRGEGFPKDQGFDSIGLRGLSVKTQVREDPLNGRGYHGSLLLSRRFLQGVRRVGSPPADPVGADTDAPGQAVTRRDAVHHGAVSPLGVQEFQDVLPPRDRLPVSRLLS